MYKAADPGRKFRKNMGILSSYYQATEFLISKPSQQKKFSSLLFIEPC